MSAELMVIPGGYDVIFLGYFNWNSDLAISE